MDFCTPKQMELSQPSFGFGKKDVIATISTSMAAAGLSKRGPNDHFGNVLHPKIKQHKRK